jgi:RNA polymerase sigma-70 factor (ECF subfamily)
MTTDDPDRRLNSISTLWTVVCRAHAGATEEVRDCQRRLVQRYGGAVYRYLLGALGDPHAAADLAQEFALRFVEGKFSQADPRHGRFRDFLKGVLAHLIADHYRQRKQQGPLLDPARETDALAGPPGEPGGSFLEGWREELLNRAWEALRLSQAQTGHPYFAVLRFRVDHPGLSSTQLAEQLSTRLGKPLTPAGLRQVLHRARDRFADLLLDEVAQTLRAPTADDLEQELIDLGLLDYCRAALDRHRGRA